MSTVAVVDTAGKRIGEVAVPPALEGKPHTAVLHEALLWQLAGRRRGTHSTLTRGFVNRTTRKLYRQKGTGRARHGSRNAGLFVGGGVIFGPSPRSYAYPLSKQVRRLALRSALAAKVAAGQLSVLDRLELSEPKTKVLAGLVRGLAGERGERSERGAPGRVLLITAALSPIVKRSAANLPQLQVLPATALNLHAILSSDQVVVTQDALARLAEAVAR